MTRSLRNDRKHWRIGKFREMESAAAIGNSPTSDSTEQVFKASAMLFHREQNGEHIMASCAPTSWHIWMHVPLSFKRIGDHLATCTSNPANHTKKATAKPENKYHVLIRVVQQSRDLSLSVYLQDITTTKGAIEMNVISDDSQIKLFREYSLELLVPARNIAENRLSMFQKILEYFARYCFMSIRHVKELITAYKAVQ